MPRIFRFLGSLKVSGRDIMLLTPWGKKGDGVSGRAVQVSRFQEVFLYSFRSARHLV